MVRNSTEKLVARREPRGSALSCIRDQHNPYKHLQCGIMLVLKGVVLLHDPLYFCTILEE